jgi:hypothetical protein
VELAGGIGGWLLTMLLFFSISRSTKLFSDRAKGIGAGQGHDASRAALPCVEACTNENSLLD